MALVLAGCSAAGDEGTPLEQAIERTHEHTFDLRYPPTRGQVGLAAGDGVVEFACEQPCDPYTFTFVLPSGETTSYVVDRLRVSTDGGSHGEPTRFVFESEISTDALGDSLRRRAEQFNLDEEALAMVMAGADSSTGERPCDGYVQPSISVRTDTGDPTTIQLVSTFDWDGEPCGPLPATGRPANN